MIRIFPDNLLRKEIFDAAPLGILITQNFKIIYTNRAFLELSQYESVDELIGKDIDEFIPFDQKDMMQRRNIAREQGYDVPIHYKTTGIRKDGAKLVVQLYISTIQLTGKPATLIFINDITEVTSTKEALDITEKKYELLTENIPAVTWITDHSGNTSFISSNIEQIYGFTKEEIRQGGLWFDRIHPDDVDMVKTQYSLLFEDNNRFDVEYRIKRKDGQWIWLHDRAISMVETEGKRVAYGIFFDITDRKKTEMALEENEARFRFLFEKSHDAVRIFSKNHKLVDINQAALDLFEYDKTEIFDIQASEIFYDSDDRYNFEEQLAKNGRIINLEVKIKTKLNNYKIGLLNTIPRFDINGEVVEYYSIIHDFSRQKMAEKALRESEKKYKNLVETSPNLVWLLNRDGEITYVNPAVEKILGYKPEQIIGTKFYNLKPLTTIDATQKAFSKILSGNSFDSYETTYLSKNGQQIVLVFNSIPLIDEKGEVIGVQGIGIDMTRYKALEVQFFEAQKMEALGRLTSGVAHDFNNVLAIIQGSCEILLHEAQHDETTYQDIKNIIKAAEDGSGLVKQLLAFSRQHPLNPERINLNTTIKTMWGMVQKALSHKIKIELQLADRLETVYVDPVQIGQVLMNLIINARDAMPNGGKLTIKTENLENNVLLKISDTGIGMDKDTKDRIFEPFFSTKGKEGTGLGLSTVYGILTQSGGSITVDSELGFGSTFNILLPSK
ncbi:MAG: PAS domain-containing sensor histidine kinase [Candidatus Kariarchaeaceae archaeon]